KDKLKSSNKKVRRFQIVKSGTKHSFFVITTLPTLSINKLTGSIFDTTIQAKEQHSRYIERLLPISFICKAYDDDLRRLIIKREFIDQLLSLDTENSTVWFDVQAKKSNNTLLKSSQLEEIIISDLLSRKPEDLNGKVFKRDYKKPQIHILLHVIRNVILISIVRNFDLYKKYNLSSINLAVTTTEEGKQQHQQPTKIIFEAAEEEDDDDDDTEKYIEIKRQMASMLFLSASVYSSRSFILFIFGCTLAVVLMSFQYEHKLSLFNSPRLMLTLPALSLVSVCGFGAGK
ncbi:unnamed protein product, partial [Rotaria magnacalcarata]